MATYESRKYAIPGANITNIAATAIADGSVNDTEFQSVDTTTSISTQLGTKLPKAGGTMTGGIVFPDDTGPAPAKVSFGAGDDLRVFSDGTTGFLKGNDIRVVNSSDVEMIKATSGGASLQFIPTVTVLDLIVPYKNSKNKSEFFPKKATLLSGLQSRLIRPCATLFA